MSSSKARRIGGDWVECTDPNSGKIYYANLKSKETSWVMPAEVKEIMDAKAKAAVGGAGGGGGSSKPAAPSSKPSAPSRADSSTLSSQASQSSLARKSPTSANPAEGGDDQWLERQDPRSGKTYYYNPTLKQTSWTKPDKTVTAAGGDANAGKGQWAGRVDPRTGRTFYFNMVTKMTSWTNPDEAEASAAESPRASASAPRAAAARPPVPAASKPAPSPRVSNANKRISMQPKAEEEPAFEAAPQAPTNRTSTRASIRLGAIPNAPKAGSRLSMADVQRQKKAELTGALELEEAQTPSLEDRFAKLRALRERAQPGVQVQEDEVKEDKKQIDLADLAREAKAGVDFDLPFEEYAKEHFATSKKGLFGSKAIPLGDLIYWRADKIKTALHNLVDPALVHDAVLAFGNIQLYMGDVKGARDKMVNALKVFRITGGRCPEELRDEVFCQLIKQTSQNPSRESCCAGWELMVIACGLFPASNKLQNYLISYLNRSAKSPSHQGVQRLAEYALVRLTKSMDLGPRTEVPTDVELVAARELRPVTIRVHMLDGSITPMEAESWMTVSDLNANMARSLGIKDPTPFSVFEIAENDEERALEEDDRILDVIAYWDREQKAAKSKKNAPRFQFVYKVHLFFDIKEDDTKAVEVAYFQAVHDVTDSRYPCSEDDCFRLAALQAQQRFGDCDGSDVFGKELQAFLPAKYYHPDIEKDLKAEIMSTYSLLKGYDAHEAMNNYLDYVKSWKIYGSQYFFVEPQNQKAELPPDVVLAVNSGGVLLVDPASKEFLAEYPYSEVVTWGQSSITFVLVVGNLMRQNKLYFKTDQGAEINRLVHAYVNRLVEG